MNWKEVDEQEFFDQQEQYNLIGITNYIVGPNNIQETEYYPNGENGMSKAKLLMNVETKSKTFLVR